MIEQLKNIPPVIDLGFGITQKQVAAAAPVTVWLNTLYNVSAYSFMLMAPQGSITIISDYEYEVTYAAPGTYEITLAVSTPDKKISLASNILNVIVT